MAPTAAIHSFVLSLMRNRAFASATLITLVIGAAIYGTTFIVPQFLAGISGYNPRQSGPCWAIAQRPLDHALVAHLPEVIVMDVKKIAKDFLVMLADAFAEPANFAGRRR